MPTLRRRSLQRRRLQQHLPMQTRSPNNNARDRRRVRSMAEKVAKVGIKKEAGYLYFVDKEGDISRAPKKHGRRSE